MLVLTIDAMTAIVGTLLASRSNDNVSGNNIESDIGILFEGGLKLAQARARGSEVKNHTGRIHGYCDLRRRKFSETIKVAQNDDNGH